jgi:hypothetical protein
MGLAAVLGKLNFEFQHLIEFKTEFENSLGYESSVYVGSFHTKTEVNNLVLLSL